MTAATMSPERIGTARRVTMHEARRVFLAGGTVLVSDRGHETEHAVYPSTTVHTRDTIEWSDLVEMVRMWRNRYPGQRFYVVSYAGRVCTFPPVLVDAEDIRPGDILPAAGSVIVDHVDAVPEAPGRSAAYVVTYRPGARSRYTRTPLEYGYYFPSDRVHVSREVTR